MIDISHAQKRNIGFEYIIDQLTPSSPYGAALVKRIKIYAPSERERLEADLDNVERAVEAVREFPKRFSMLRRHMAALKDIRRSVETLDRLELSDVELFELKRYLLQLELIAPEFKEINRHARFHDIIIEPLTCALNILDPDGGRIAAFHISGGLSEKLASIRAEKRRIEDAIRAETKVEAREALRLKRTEIVAREDGEEDRLRRELCEKLAVYKRPILESMDNMARFDFTLARAALALRLNAKRPVITEGKMRLDGMINPQTAESLKARGSSFAPISIALERGAAVVTGANMGGKSVALKTIALNVFCAHCALFVFAENAELPLFDAMHLISEDLEDDSRGLSSFGAEIVRFNEALEDIKGKGLSLLLLDEFARGTNPEEGAMIVKGIVGYLGKMNAISVLTTHYDNVANHAAAHYRVVGLKGVDMDRLKAEIGPSGKGGVEIIERHMNYGLFLVEDSSGAPRDALNICRLLGMDGAVMEAITGKTRNP